MYSATGNGNSDGSSDGDEDVNSVSENAYSNEIVARALVDLLSVKYPKNLKEYYGLDDSISVEDIALSRNWIVSGGTPDIERTSAYILRDFREGKIGKFILD